MLMLSAKEDHAQTLISRDMIEAIDRVRTIVGVQVAGVALYDAAQVVFE